MDLYAYMVQTRDYFERGDGARLFGTEQSIVAAGIPRLVVGTRAFAQSVAGEQGVATGVGAIEEWAREHPVRGPYFLRESLVGDWSEVFGSTGGSAFATLGHMEQSVEEISERLQFINETMLKQVRWNAELLMSGLARPEDLEAARMLLARANELTAGLPELISRERTAVLDAIRGGTHRGVPGHRSPASGNHWRAPGRACPHVRDDAFRARHHSRGDAR